jgi:tetratricopeptide (TPR) repeat protein
MTRKDELLSILEQSQQARQQYLAGLSDEQKSESGTYEEWAAKDMLAHSSHWVQHQAARLEALATGGDAPSSHSHFEAANLQCFEEHCEESWEQVLEFTQSAHQQLVQAVRAISEEALLEPSSEGAERALWEEVVGAGYTHPLMHISDRLSAADRDEEAGLLWQSWGRALAPLSDRPEWQGNVHYNLACSLALLGQPDDALEELRQALELRPGLLSWSRHDSDLAALHGLMEYKKLYAAEHWWAALEAGPQADALTDQFIRTLTMVRSAIQSFRADQWTTGDSDFQRPAGLTLHLLGSLHGYCALRAGESGVSEHFEVSWDEKDSSKLPSQEEMLSYLDVVEQNVSGFLSSAELADAEERYPWTGSTQLGRALHMLRHTQQHLGELCMEMHLRGLKAPEWQ